MNAEHTQAGAPNNSQPDAGKGEASSKSPRKAIDWARIEPGWRAGIKSVLQLAADYEKATGQKVSHTAINKHFKGLGVPRDLADKVRAKADALVSVAVVSGAVSTETTATEAQIIEANAALQAQVRQNQRADIQRARALAMKLLGELEAATDNIELFRQLGEIMAKPDEKGNADKMAELYAKVTSLSGRTGNMKALAESMRVLVALEREAFGIDDRPKPPAPKQTSTDLALLDDDELAQYEQLVRKSQVPM